MTTTFPLDKISEALDVLQDHGVIGDNDADHSLACWLHENDLTCADLNNYKPECASEEQLLPLVQSILDKYENDERNMAWSLAYFITDGGRASMLQEALEDFSPSSDD